MVAKKNKYGNKTQFIREHSDMSPADIVEEGKKQGVSLTVEYVYNVRAKDNMRNKVRQRVVAPAPAGDVESQFRRLVRQLGTLKARELLTKFEQE